MHVIFDNAKMLPTGRPLICLADLLRQIEYPFQEKNPCTQSLLIDPKSDSHMALVKGLRKILPFIYRSLEQNIQILMRYGMNFANAIPIPTSFSFQFAHAGEILACAYYEECEDVLIPIYKWRLNTSNNQNQLGMDLIGFKFSQPSPEVYLIAVKTTVSGEDGKTPSVVYSAINELKTYLSAGKIDDDLEIIAANVDGEVKKTFLDWYDPYSQGVPIYKPSLIVAPSIVAEEKYWKDEYALPAMRHDFGVKAKVKVITVEEIENLVRQVYVEAANGK